MIHVKCYALDQLVFSADVALTLQQARAELANESDVAKNLVCKLTGEEMRSNMTEIGVAMYRIGKIESTTLSQDECTLIGSSSTTELTFSWAYYEGVLYQYARHNGKRNSTICTTIRHGNRLQIEALTFRSHFSVDRGTEIKNTL